MLTITQSRLNFLPLSIHHRYRKCTLRPIFRSTECKEWSGDFQLVVSDTYKWLRISSTIFIFSTFSVLRPLYFRRFTSTSVLRTMYFQLCTSNSVLRLAYFDLLSNLDFLLEDRSKYSFGRSKV